MTMAFGLKIFEKQCQIWNHELPNRVQTKISLKIRKLILLGPKTQIWTQSLKNESQQKYPDIPYFEMLPCFWLLCNFVGLFWLILGCFGWFWLVFKLFWLIPGFSRYSLCELFDSANNFYRIMNLLLHGNTYRSTLKQYVEVKCHIYKVQWIIHFFVCPTTSVLFSACEAVWAKLSSNSTIA